MPAPRPLRFLLVGLWNTAFGYGLFVALVALTRLLGISYLYATVPTQIISVLMAYVCHRTFTWVDGDKSFRGFLRFNVVYWVMFCINVPLLVALVDGVKIPPEVAQALLIIGNTVISYVAHGRWSFRTRESDTSGPRGQQ